MSAGECTGAQREHGGGGRGGKGEGARPEGCKGKWMSGWVVLVPVSVHCIVVVPTPLVISA